MAKKKVPHQAAYKNIAKRLAETRSASKPSVPMGGKPVDFSAIPEVNISDEWMAEGEKRLKKIPKVATPKVRKQGKGMPVSRMEETVRQVMREHPKRASEVVPGEARQKAREAFEAGRRKTALPPLTADTIPMVEEAAPVFQNRPSTLGQAGRNAMERQYLKNLDDQAMKMAKAIAPNTIQPGAKGSGKKLLDASIKKIFGILKKNPKLIGALGGPAGVAMMGFGEAADAAPVGMGSGMAGGVPGAEYVGQGPALAPMPEQFAGRAEPVPGFDVPLGGGRYGPMPVQPPIPNEQYNQQLTAIPGY